MVNIVHKSRKRLIWELASGVSGKILELARSVSGKILELARGVSRNWLGAYLGSTGIFPRENDYHSHFFGSTNVLLIMILILNKRSCMVTWWE